MKRVLAIVLLFNSALTQAQVNWISNDWDQAKANASESQKMIMMDCYTTWCGWCKVMDKETFGNAEVAAYLQNNFVCLKMDMEKGAGVKLAMKYGVSGFPTILVFNSKAQLIYRSTGYLKPEPFLKAMKEAVEEVKPIKGYSNELNLNYPQFLYDASDGDPSTKYPKEDEVIAYLDKQSDLFYEVNWTLIKRFVPGGKYRTFFLDNIDKYSELYGQSEVNDLLDKILYADLNSAIMSKNESDYKALLGRIEKYKPKEFNDYKAGYDIMYYKGVHNWKEFAKAVESSLNNDDDFEVEAINEYSWSLYESCDDTDVIKSAIEWMRKVVAKEPQYAYLDTYAALFYKSGQYKDALKYADLAIAKGRENGEDVKSTEELMIRINESMKK